MAIDLTPEQRTVGEGNFNSALPHLPSRRNFLKAAAAATGAAGVSAGAIYFGYESLKGKPVKAALIGAGDEGGVLVGEHNPDFLKFVAVCDIRPSNVKRIYEGDPKSPLRKGFKKVYGKGVQTKDHPDYIEPFTDYKDMLEKRKDIEAVVVAVPLHLHAPVTIDCLNAGKHVLCEKLMARTTAQCKEMIRTAQKNKRVLSIGHQRHYSMLYTHAQEVIQSSILGDVKHIRALWHRNFSWPFTPDAKAGKMVDAKIIPHPAIRDGWYPPVYIEDFEALKDDVKKYGYDSVEQLIRWRLYEKTGGGLMAELGSHQLDAASIFLGKVKPLSVSGVGTRSFFGPGKNPREIDDHVFVTFEFPGNNHPRGKGNGRDENDVVVVTYSSISTNGFEAYGECLMGTRGTMIVEAEQKVMLFTEKDPTKKGDPKLMEVNVAAVKKDGAAAESSSTWGGPAASTPAGAGGAAASSGPISRGYREEMEDFAYCVRTWEEKLGYEKNKDGTYKQRLPRCHGEVAMADAIIALTSNLAMRKRQRIEFKKSWFDVDSEEVPETL